MKKPYLFVIAFVFLFSPSLLSQEVTLGNWTPAAPSPFKIPDKYKKLLKDYRTQWVRLTGLQYSGLHWNLGIVIYINQEYKVFVNNYIGYLKVSQGLDEECEEEEEEETVGEDDMQDLDEELSSDDEELFALDDDEDTEEILDCSFPYQKYQVGTIILKENYLLKKGIPKEPVSITLMIKRQSGYDEQGGNWQYLQFDSRGEILVEGSKQKKAIQQQCANCHMNIHDRDFIFSTFYQPIRNSNLSPPK